MTGPCTPTGRLSRAVVGLLAALVAVLLVLGPVVVEAAPAAAQTPSGPQPPS